MSVFEKNCATLLSKIPEEKDTLEQWKERNTSGNCILKLNQKGELVPCILRNDYEWYLNSRYDAGKAAEKFVERYQEKKPYYIYFVFGFSDGKIIRKMLSHMDDSNQLLIYEPDIDIFMSVIKEESYLDILEDDRVYLIIGDAAEHHLDNYIGALLLYNRKELLEFIILPGYDILYPAECRLYMDRIIFVKQNAILQRNTAISAKESLTKNILSNMYSIVNGSDITRLKEKFTQKNITGIPAIVVSAGPSLDRNIMYLKKAEGKAFIIVVDAAVKAVLRAGIHFQVQITVDPNKELSLFEDERILHIPLVSEPYSRIELIKKHDAKKIFSYGYGSEILSSLLKDELDYRPEELTTGGSVATDAFSLARYLGFQTIILVGQDLAFTGDRGHVSSVYDDEKANREHLKSRALTIVEGIDGKPVKTDLQMAMYIKWFEKEIRNLSGIVKVIDATEGGARKKGAVIMTLEDAILQECRKEMDFDSMINECENTFSEEKKQRIYAELKKLPEDAEHFCQVLANGIDCYERLKKFCEDGQMHTKQFHDCVKEVEQYSKLEQTEKLMPLVALYAREAEYHVQDDIFAKEDMSVEEIAERGKQLLGEYQKATRELMEQLPVLMEQLPM